MTKKSKKPMFNKAGSDVTKANKSVRIPLAPSTNRSTLPTFTTLTTRKTVGEKVKYNFLLS